MSPANIEATITSAGSVTLDPEAVATAGDLQAAVAAQIDRANERLARVEQIKRFAVLPGAGRPAATS